MLPHIMEFNSIGALRKFGAIAAALNRAEATMDITGLYRIEAPRDVVWAALNDPEVLKRCIPGCKELEQKSPTEMSAKVTLKIGPISANFNGNVTLEDLDPPNGYTIVGQGQGGAAGFAKGRASVTLSEAGDATDLAYTAKAEVGGKLATLGGRLIQATSKKLADEIFGTCVRELNGEDAASQTGDQSKSPDGSQVAGGQSKGQEKTSRWKRWLGRA
jgi:carbon monoxide dehydrogenase subunit G